MTTKNIQDVVDELKEQRFYQYLQVAGFHKEAEEWLAAYSKRLVTVAREEEMGRCIDLAWEYTVKVERQGSGSRAEMKEALTPPTSDVTEK